MTTVRRFIHRLATLFRSTKAERELAREIEAHLRLVEDEFVAKGMSRDEARYAAKRAFGGVEQAKEHHRDARAFRLLAGWPMDLKLGVRMLARTPGLTVIAVLALAVAIGAAAAYLELTRDLLSPRLNTPGAERIVGIKIWSPERLVQEPVPLEEFLRWRASSQTLEDVGAERPDNRHLTTADGMTEPVRGVAISASAFRVIPAPPLLGRTLTDADEGAGAAEVAVIGYGLWVSRFNSDPGVVGATIRLGSSVHTIVGVMPDGFGFPVNHNLWLPLKSGGPVAIAFARLKEGATVASAQGELDAMWAGSPQLTSRPAGGVRPAVRVHLYADSFMADDGGGLEIMVFRAVNMVFVLLLGICGANVATLVFARTAMRESEITVRTALGASRGRISAQLFAEALVLCLLAAFAGLGAAKLVGQWGTSLYRQGIGALPFWWDDRFGYLTIAYAFGLAVLAALIVGVIPAMKATGRDLQGRLRESASGTSTMKFGGLWTTVIVVQAALTVVFLATVVALGWTGFKKQKGADVTYSRDQLLTARVGIDGDAADPARDAAIKAAAHNAIAERLAREPGVASVSYATALPGTIWEQFEFELRSPELQAAADARRLTETLWSEGAAVGEHFFETVGIPLIAGREFTPAEIRQAAPVAIVDETFVQLALGGRSAIGVTIRQRARSAEQQPGPWLEIVGVVKSVSLRNHNGPEDAAIYRPAKPGGPMRLVVRTQGAAAAMTQRVYAAAREAHADVRFADLKSAAQVVHDDGLPDRIFLRAFTVIGAIALLLATAGIYALISFTLARRTREIGIRMALGAEPRNIISGVFARSFRQIGIGVAAGALPALVIMESVTGDVVSFNLAASVGATIGVCAFVVLVALISCTVPLRRALRVQPTDALRSN